MPRFGAIHNKYVKITKPDNSGFEKNKWVKSLNNWIKLLEDDKKKSFFDKNLSDHSNQISDSKHLIAFIHNGDYANVVKKCEFILSKNYNYPSPIDNKILWPLGKQAYGMVKGKSQVNAKSSEPVTFTKEELHQSSCTIL